MQRASKAIWSSVSPPGQWRCVVCARGTELTLYLPREHQTHDNGSYSFLSARTAMGSVMPFTLY